MRLRHLLLALPLLAPAAVRADEFDGRPTLSNKDKAVIEADQDERHKAIDDKYKDDNSPEARRNKMKEYGDADKEVIQKHGLDQHDYAVQTSPSSPEDREEIAKTKEQVLDQRKKEAEEKAKEKNKASDEPQVIKGFDDAHPLDVEGGEQAKAEQKPPALDENGNPLPAVEKLNPADDPNAAGGDAAAAPPAQDLSNTPVKTGGGGHRRRHGG